MPHNKDGLIARSSRPSSTTSEGGSKAATVPERTLRQFAATLTRLRAAGDRVEIE
jgi:hypothetical protein